MQSAAKNPLPYSVCWHGFPLLLALTALSVALPVSGSADDDFRESVAASPGETFEVEIDFGDGLRPDPGFVRLSSHKGNEVVVRIDTSGWGSWDVEVDLERRSGRARLDVRARGTTTWMFGGPNIRIDVDVPEKVGIDIVSWGGNVRVEGVVGSVRGSLHDADIRLRDVKGRVKLNLEDSSAAEVEEVRGDFEVSTDSGSVRAGRISGRAEVRSNEGRVELHHVKGPITAKSLDADIEMDEIHGPVNVRSEGGHLTVRFAQASGGLIESGAGDVTVTLPAGAGAEVDAKARGGTVDVAARFAGERSETHAVGAVGDGGKRLVLRSASGAVRVNQ